MPCSSRCAARRRRRGAAGAAPPARRAWTCSTRAGGGGPAILRRDQARCGRRRADVRGRSSHRPPPARRGAAGRTLIPTAADPRFEAISFKTQTTPRAVRVAEELAMSSRRTPHGGALMSRTIGSQSRCRRLHLAFFTLILFSPPWRQSRLRAQDGARVLGCHEVWPRLNDFGVLYRDGLQAEARPRAPVQQDPSYWPLRSAPPAGLPVLRNTWWPRTSGPPTQTGSFGFTGSHDLAAGTSRDKLCSPSPIRGSPRQRGRSCVRVESGSASTTSSSKLAHFRVGSTRSTCPIDVQARSR